MKTLSVTYKAPPGDTKAVEAYGHTFYDGKQETITVDDHVAEKLKGNRHFQCGEAKDAKEGDHKSDPEAEAREAKAAERADHDKAAAQGYSPPLRGAQSNPPPDPNAEPDEPDDPDAPDEGGETGEAAAHNRRGFQGER